LVGSPEFRDQVVIPALVKNLNDDVWRTRENATNMLDKIGAPALPELRKALWSTSPEVVNRASNLVTRIEARETWKVRTVTVASQKKRMSEFASELCSQLGYKASWGTLGLGSWNAPEDPVIDWSFTGSGWDGIEQLAAKANVDLSIYGDGPIGSTFKGDKVLLVSFVKKSTGTDPVIVKDGVRFSMKGRYQFGWGHLGLGVTAHSGNEHLVIGGFDSFHVTSLKMDNQVWKPKDHVWYTPYHPASRFAPGSVALDRTIYEWPRTKKFEEVHATITLTAVYDLSPVRIASPKIDTHVWVPGGDLKIEGYGEMKGTADKVTRQFKIKCSEGVRLMPNTKFKLSAKGKAPIETYRLDDYTIDGVRYLVGYYEGESFEQYEELEVNIPRTYSKSFELCFKDVVVH
jgi:hypothetical protein